MNALAHALWDPPEVDEAANHPAMPCEADACCRQQWDYETSEVKFRLVLCGRRAGKTASILRRVIRKSVTCAGRKTLYVTLIRRNCRKLFWRPLLARLTAMGVSFEANEVDMTCRLANGALIEATSCDDVRSAGKIRGDFYDEVFVDEAQEPGDDVIEPLVEEVLFPMLIDRGGQLTLSFTPPASMVGYVMDRLSDLRWSRFGWSMFDNKYIPRAQIEEMIAAKGLTPEHPVYQREILGMPVVDPESLAYEYDPARNDYDPATFKFEGPQWRHAMGLDLGFQDRDAIVVGAWDRDDATQKCRVRFTWQENHQDVDQLAAKVREVVKEYRPSVIVGDHGGHGAVKVLETLKNRMGIMIQLKPADVMVSVGLVNDDLRTGRLLLPVGSELGRDLGLVQRTVNQRTRRIEINKKGYHSDLSEAMRYMHHGARHFTSKAPPPPETLEERRMRRHFEEMRHEEDPFA